MATITTLEPTTQPARSAPFYSLLVADAISMNGNALAQLAIPWFVLVTTGSAARVGVVATFGLAPFALAALFGGAVVDRLGHKRSSVLADCASLLAVAAIPLLHALDRLPFWLLLALVFLGALCDAPGATARAALAPDVATLARLRLQRANALREMVESGAQLSGPLLAGLLIALSGPSGALWLDAASFGVSAVLIAVCVPPGARDAPVAAGRYLTELAGGLRFIVADPPIRAIFVVSTGLSGAYVALFGVALPYVFHARDDAAGLGLLVGAFGGGSVLGVLAHEWRGRRRPPRARSATFVGGVYAMGAAFMVLACLPSLPVMLAALLAGGLVAGPNGPLVATALQERTPPELRGRVFGATTAISLAAAPLGALVAGAALQAAGARPVVLGIAVLFLAGATALAFNRGLRLLDAT